MAKLAMYQQIKRDLLDRIARGDIDPQVPFVTQREICDRYSVSMLTAARALMELQQEGALVSRRGRGTFVAPKRATSTESRAVSEAPPTITCIVPSLVSGDVMDAVRGVQLTASTYGFSTVIVDAQESWEKQHEALTRASHSAAVIIYPVDGAGDAAAVVALREAGVIVVFADRYWPDTPNAAVVIDNEEIGYHLVSRLIERGFERIGTLWVETDCTSVRDRQSGHLRALRDHDMNIDVELLAMREYLRLPEATRRSLLAASVAGSDRPTAFVCSNGFVLEQAIADALAMGLRVPEDIDFAGTDRKVDSQSSIPGLTAVTAVLPLRIIGEKAARIACEAALAGEQPAKSLVVVKAEFQEREDSDLRISITRLKV